MRIDNTEWLNSLKEGDVVLISDGRWRYEIRTIDKITPKRQIKIGNWVFKDGVCRGKTAWDYNTHIEPVTDEARNKIRKMELLRRMKDVKFEKLSLDELEKVFAIIESTESTQAKPVAE